MSHCVVDARPYVWHRRSYRGRVVRLAREAYLRPGLVRAQAFRIEALTASHIVICDPAVLLALLPALEDLHQWPDPPIVLLCRSVVEGLAILGDGAQWQSAKNLWLRSISTEQQSLFVPVEDVFDSEIWRGRRPDETREAFLADNIRSICAALQPALSKPIVIISDLNEYFKIWQGSHHHLLEIVQSVSLEASASKSSLYPEHWSESRMRLALQKGEIVQGRIKIRKHRRTAIVVGKTAEVLIEASDFNRSIDGDIVAVQLVSDVDQPNPLSVDAEDAVDADYYDDDDDDDDLGDNLFLDNEIQISRGRVVGVLRRCWRPYVGSITIEEGDNRRPLFIPMDKRIPRIRVFTRRANELSGQKIVVRIDRWQETSRLPEGHIVAYLGESGDVDVEVDAILNEHGIYQKPYVQADWADQLPPVDWTVCDADLEHRRDFRETHRICSIDPPGCVDIDDALSVRELGNGDIEIGVHIADVTAFLKPASRLDKEARERSTTVYLSDRRLNMLPELLSENLCSLHENTDRLAVSVLWTFTKKDELVINWIGRSVIRSKYALAYEEAQAIVNGKTPSGQRASAIEMHSDLKHLERVGRWLRSNRLAKGALEIESFEAHFDIENRNGTSNIDMKLHDDLEFHSIVAEFMIAANCAVADHIWNSYPAHSLLRRHLSPDQHKFGELQKLVSLLGGSLEFSSNKALADSMRNLSAVVEDEWAVRVIKSFTARCLTEAQYVCSAATPVEQLSHYGLAAKLYTHFTSPIRRYADVIVHRQLLHAIEGNDSSKLLASDILVDVCDHINDRNRSAKLAQRDCSDLFWALFVSSQGESTTEALVLSFSESGRIGIFIPKFGRKSSFEMLRSDGTLHLCNDNSQDDFLGELSLHSSGTSMEVRVHSICRRFVLRLFDRLFIRISPHESGNKTKRPIIKLVWDTKQQSPVVKTLKASSQIIIPQEFILGNRTQKKVSNALRNEMSSVYDVINELQTRKQQGVSSRVREQRNVCDSRSKYNFRRCGNRLSYTVMESENPG